MTSPPGVDALHNPTVGHTIERVMPALSRTCGRTVAKSVNSSGSISASGCAFQASIRWRTLLLAASPASFQPVNAAMIVGRCSVGWAIQRTWSIADKTTDGRLRRPTEAAGPAPVVCASRGGAFAWPGTWPRRPLPAAQQRRSRSCGCRRRRCWPAQCTEMSDPDQRLVGTSASSSRWTRLSEFGSFGSYTITNSSPPRRATMSAPTNGRQQSAAPSRTARCRLPRGHASR